MSRAYFRDSVCVLALISAGSAFAADGPMVAFDIESTGVDPPAGKSSPGVVRVDPPPLPGRGAAIRANMQGVHVGLPLPCGAGRA